MIGDVWYDDVEVAQLPETNNASRRKMSAEEKCPAAEMAAVSLDAIKWINWQWGAFPLHLEHTDLGDFRL